MLLLSSHGTAVRQTLLSIRHPSMPSRHSTQFDQSTGSPIREHGHGKPIAQEEGTHHYSSQYGSRELSLTHWRWLIEVEDEVRVDIFLDEHDLYLVSVAAYPLVDIGMHTQA